MNITVDDPDQIFWLDSIEYSPLDSADLTGQVLRVYANDPRSCFYPGVFGDGGTSNDWLDVNSGIGPAYTRIFNASMSFRFNGMYIGSMPLFDKYFLSLLYTGTSVSMYGWIEGEAAVGATGSYHIDGGSHPTVAFEIPKAKPMPSRPADLTGWVNQLFFTTNLTLEGGNSLHEMNISYGGNNDKTNQAQPLIIDYFHVENSIR